MIIRLVKEIQECIKTELYMSALFTALTLPDICGKAEYPDYGNKRRYIDWLKKYSNKDFINATEIYDLRNNLLHQGTPTIKNKGICYTLMINNDANKSLTRLRLTNKLNEKLHIDIDIKHVCNVLGSVAYNYYVKYRDKFNFINYRLVDENDREIRIEEYPFLQEDNF